METIFKKEDRVFDYHHGWGEVIAFDNHDRLIVKFKEGNVFYDKNGRRGNSYFSTLSFTEYTLQGFSQERPIDCKDYIGKWGAFWDDDYDEYRLIRRLNRFSDGYFKANGEGWYNNFKPLTDEQIKALEL